MWIKNKKINILKESIEKLIKILEKSNYLEWSHLLRKQKRNNKKKHTSRNSKRSWNRNRSNNNHSHISNDITKNSHTKHSCNRRIYIRHYRNS